MPSESDRLLVQQIRAGDSRAWDGLIARYEGRLLAFVDRRLRDRAAIAIMAYTFARVSAVVGLKRDDYRMERVDRRTFWASWTVDFC